MENTNKDTKWEWQFKSIYNLAINEREWRWKLSVSEVTEQHKALLALLSRGQVYKMPKSEAVCRRLFADFFF